MSDEHIPRSLLATCRHAPSDTISYDSNGTYRAKCRHCGELFGDPVVFPTAWGGGGGQRARHEYAGPTVIAIGAPGSSDGATGGNGQQPEPTPEQIAAAILAYDAALPVGTTRPPLTVHYGAIRAALAAAMGKGRT